VLWKHVQPVSIIRISTQMTLIRTTIVRSIHSSITGWQGVRKGLNCFTFDCAHFIQAMSSFLWLLDTDCQTTLPQ